MALAGKTLQGKRKTRGVDDPEEQMRSFVEIFDSFSSNLASLDEPTRNGFMERGNDLFAERNIGGVLGSGDADLVTETLSDL